MSNICRYFSQDGKCPFGETCNFLHQSLIPQHVEQSNPGTHRPRPCKYIALHGYCRNRDKGCEFSHDISPGNLPGPYEQHEEYHSVPDIYLKSQDNSPQNPFVNRTSRAFPPNPPWTPDYSQGFGYDSYSEAIPQNYPSADTYRAPHQEPYAYHSMNYQSPLTHAQRSISEPSRVSGWEHSTIASDRVAVTQGGTTYFYAADIAMEPTVSPYMPVIPPHPKNGRRSVSSYFISEDLRQQFLKRSRSSLAQLDETMSKMLPALVGRYHGLYPLDNPNQEKTSDIFGFYTWLYKAISGVDHLPYVLWRIEAHRLSNEIPLGSILEFWRSISHPNIVALREIFSTNEFGDNSSIFVYDYFPDAVTLEQEYLHNHSGYLSEDMLWSFIIQLISALQTIHSVNLACRMIFASKIIITGKNRLRISGVGILDVLQPDLTRNNNQKLELQRQDLLDLGVLILSLSCKFPVMDNFQEAIEQFSQRFSPELVLLIRNLCTGEISSVAQFFEYPEFTPHILQDSVYLHDLTDYWEKELRKELEAGRLFRLCAKLGIIADRPEFGMNTRRGEQGERYFLKLFRDHVFHRNNEDGTPIVDLAHTIDSLIKLDVGSPEPVLLTFAGRSEKTLTVLSYEELKRSVDNYYQELHNKPTQPQYY